MYEAVVFDNDGVLLDLTPMDLHRQGAREAFVAAGVDDPDPEDVEAISIAVTVPVLTEICERYGFDPETFWETRDRVLSRLQRQAMRDGRKRPYDDVALLAEFDCPLGIVTSNQAATAAFAFEYFDLDHHFETVQARPPTIEGIRRKKPSAYYVERALAELGTTDAVLVGDSETDVEAAHAAGIDAAFARRPHRRDHDLSVDPEYEVEGLADVLALVSSGSTASD